MWTCIKHPLHELLLFRLKSNRLQEKCLQVLDRNICRPLLGWFFGRAPCSFCGRVGLLTFLGATFLQLQQNLLQPRKRPRSFLLPTIVRPSEGMCGTYLCLGANNGDRALSSIVQVGTESSQSSWVPSFPFLIVPGWVRTGGHRLVVQPLVSPVPHFGSLKSLRVTSLLFLHFSWWHHS